MARCPQCQRFFCRECVTEHDDRVICASCLAKIAAAAKETRSRFRAVSTLLGCVAGVLLAWIVFYGIGQALLAMPSSFHEGTVWSPMGRD